jgi:large repetitive protein
MKLFYIFSLLTFFGIDSVLGQFPGCPTINAGPDQTIPCTQSSVNLLATPFATGATTTYGVSPIAYAPPTPYDLVAGTGISIGTDDVWGSIVTLPFSFCYYGVNYNTINVGSNGAIQFAPASGGGYHPWSYTASCPSVALVNAGDIFGVYHDIDPSIIPSGNPHNTRIEWQVLGTAPCRIMVVSFNHVPHFSCGVNLRSTHMMVLYETTNVIDVYVESKQTCASWNVGRAIIGIQKPDGTAGIAAPGRNANANWTVNTPEAWRFTPTGAPNYVVSWFQGATLLGNGNAITVSPSASSTTYTSKVVYTNCNGTQITKTDDVIVNYGTLVAPTLSSIAETCSGASNGSISIDNVAGAGPYTVVISGPTTQTVIENNTTGVANFSGLPAGAYSYTSTGQHGCTNAGSFSIAPGPSCCTVTASSTNLTCNGVNNGTISATPSNTSGVVTYAWVPSNSGQTVTGLPPGTYNLTMTDAGGCVATASTTITGPSAIIASATVVSPTCNNVCNGSITVTASGGTGVLSYKLNSSGTYQASNSFTGKCSGSYTVFVKDANGCEVQVSATLVNPPILSETITVITPATCGAANGAITVTASGGTAPYSYTNNGGTSQTTTVFGSLAANTYNVVVTDSRGCTATATGTVVNQSAPIPTILSQTNVNCFAGNTGTILIGGAGGVGPYTYKWVSNPVGSSIPFQTSNSFINLLAGCYVATIRDANGCEGTLPFCITQPTQVTYTVTPTNVTCNGLCDGQISFSASGGTSPYSYSTGGPSVPSSLATGLCPGIYNTVLSDVNGCISSLQTTITQPAVLTATYINTAPTCHDGCNGSIAVTPSGGSTPYQYSVNTSAIQAGSTLGSLCSGPNTVHVTDARGCVVNALRSLINPPAISIDTLATEPSNCGSPNGSLTLQAVGLHPIVSYTLTNTAGYNVTNSTGFFGGLFGASYLCHVVDNIGCTSDVYFAVNDVEISGFTVAQTNATCFGADDGYISVQNVNGSGIITFYQDNLVGSQQTSNGDFFSIAPNSHVITFFDQGSCVFSIPFNLVEPDTIVFNQTITNIACSGAATGSITINSVTGGDNLVYEYSKDGGATFQSSPTFNGLPVGTYQLAVRDGNLCLGSATATVIQSPPLQLQTNSTDVLCNGGNDGTILLGASGGQGSYQFSFNNGATYSAVNTTLTNTAGVYQVCAKDVAGCSVCGSVTITQPSALTASYVTDSTSCNTSCDGLIAITATGGTTPYQYSVDNGVNYAVVSSFNTVCSGIKTVKVKDFNNCIISSTQTIIAPTAITFTSTVSNASCSLSNGSILFNATGGTAPYSYNTNGGSGPFAASNSAGSLAAGFYNLQVKDAKNCPVLGTASITNQASPLITNVAITTPLCFGNNTAAVTVTVSGGTAPLSYSLNGVSQAGATFSSLAAGTYPLIVTDANGCSDNQSVVINSPTQLAFTTTLTNLTCFNNNSGAIAFNASGGTTPYSYNIGGLYSASSTFTNLASGSFGVQVKDANNCIVGGPISISQPLALVISSKDSTNNTCNASCDGTALVNVTGGTGAYSYLWSTSAIPSVTNTASGICAGTISVIISDLNACSISTSFNITEPALLTIVSTSKTDVTCTGICDGEISINAPNATMFSIDNGITYQASNVITGLCFGTYQVKVKNAVGCTSTTSVTINQPLPLVQQPVTGDALICYDGYGTLSGHVTGGTPFGSSQYTYVWNTGDSTEYLNVNLTSPATFTCIVYDANGCESNQQTYNVAVRPKFIPSLVPSISACPGELVNVVASGVDGLPAYNFIWVSYSGDTLGTGPNLSISSIVNDSVKLIAYDACFTKDSLNFDLIIYQVPIPSVTLTGASGCSPLTANFSLNATAISSNTFDWTFGDGTTGNGSSGISHTYINVGCYDVNLTITTINGCVADSTFTDLVCVLPDPVAEFTFSPTTPSNLNNLVSFSNGSTGATTYNWTFGTYGTSTDTNPIHVFNEVNASTFNVCLTAESSNGCLNTICKPITFIEELQMFVPNSFTPDDDRFNPTFGPVWSKAITFESYSFLIFDRWGEVIFESNDTSESWDGTIKGNIVQDGVYIWTIVAKGSGINSTKKYEGHVTVIR